MTDYTDYSATPADNTSPPPVGAPEGMYPSAVNDTMREMMSVVRQLGDQTAVTFGTFGSMSLQAANNVHITGGTISATGSIHTPGTITGGAAAISGGLFVGGALQTPTIVVTSLAATNLTLGLMNAGTVSTSTLAATNGYISTLEVDTLVYSGATLLAASDPVADLRAMEATGTIDTVKAVQLLVQIAVKGS